MPRRETEPNSPGRTDVGNTAWRQLNRRRDHRWARARFSGYVDRELRPREQRRLAAHEEICPDCARLIATLQALLILLPSLRLPPHATRPIAERTAECVRAHIGEWS